MLLRERANSLASDELPDELRQRQRTVARLQEKRKKLITYIETLDAEIERLAGTGTP